VNVDPKKGWKIGGLKNEVTLSVIHFTDTYTLLNLITYFVYMRIKIEFQENIPLKIAAYRKCWFDLEPHVHTVAEFIREIEETFLLTTTIKNICNVYIDDFIVLPEQVIKKFTSCQFNYIYIYFFSLKKCSIFKETDIIYLKSDYQNVQYNML